MNKRFFYKLLLIGFVAALSVVNVFAQQQKISGTIRDNSDGSSIIGVNIVIKGKTTGTVSNNVGAYSIMASKGDTLVFTSIGYKSMEVTVEASAEININLDTEALALDELIVVGYGYQKKSNLTGSVSSITAENLAIRPVSSVAQALQGQAAGVQVTNTSGLPGSEPSIRIRGHGSLNTTNGPLWVVDGVIAADMNSVAVEDIENIEILKDASSTAIYGAKGGNGVILVTTKRGKKNENRVNFSYYHQVANLAKSLDLLDRSEYMTLKNRARTNSGFSEMFTPGQINGTEPYNGYITNTDWQAEVYRPAQTDYFNLSLAGGSDKTTYALSFNNRKENGIIPHSDYKRSGIRLNLDHEISKKINLGLSANAYKTVGNSFDVTSGWTLGAAGGALTSMPYYPVYDNNGDYYNLSTWDNPLLAAEGQYDNKINTSVQGNIYLTYEIIKDLTLKADFSGEYWVKQENTFVTSELYGATATKGLARASIMDAYNSNWVGTLSTTYDKKISENHELKLFAAVEQRVASSNFNLMSSENMSREAFLWYNMAAFDKANHAIENGNWESVFKSVFGRVNYNFLNRYLFEATVRRDGSSKFGPAEKWGTFPAVSAGWKLSEEEFIKSLGVFDQLKLRVTWGQAGNDNIGLYLWMPYMLIGGNYSGAIFGGIGSPGGDKPYIGAEIGQIPNESVHWEKSSTTDIGLDMGFLKNRLRFTLDLYNRTTADLLWNFPLPLYTGYGNGWGGGVVVISNVAEMNNKGIELNLGADIVSTGYLFWTLNFSFSKNVNKVIDLANSQPIYSEVTKIEQGKPIGNIWGYQTDGIFQEGDDIENTPRFSGDEGLGDQRYVDANNNGILSDQDMGIIGRALPDFIYGIVSTLTYKNFELNIIANGVQGADLYNGTRQTLSNGGLGKTNGGKWLLNSWTPENTNTDIPRMSDSYTDKTPSDRFVEDASFLRISNIQLSYTVPSVISSKAKMKNLSAYISLQNWFIITNYSGYDPEMHSGGDDNLNIGLDRYNYPSTKGVTFGIKVGF